MTTLISAVLSAGSSILVGVLALLGVIITNNRTQRDLAQKIAVSQAVTDTKIEELVREVREHNRLIGRVPVVEEQIRFFDHRIETLEQQTKGGVPS